MKNIYISKVKRERPLKHEGYIGVIADIELLKTAINQNKIKDYIKIPNIKQGDIMVCCSKEESFIPGDIFYRSTSAGMGYSKGLIFEVSQVRTATIDQHVILMGGNRGNGVYIDRVRFATEKEKKLYKSGKTSLLSSDEDYNDLSWLELGV